MDFTGKQERNGATGATADQNTAVPGPDASAQIASLSGQAEAMAMARKTAATLSRPGGDVGVVDWETDFASTDMPGEA